VASKASILQSQPLGLGQRERAAEARNSDSPFSMLLAAGGSAKPAPRNVSRPQSSTPVDRNGSVTPARPERPERSDNPTAAESSSPDAPETPSSQPAAPPSADAEMATADAKTDDETATGETGVASIDEVLAAGVQAQMTAEQAAVAVTPTLGADPAVTVAADAPAVAGEAPVETPAVPAVPAVLAVPVAASSGATAAATPLAAVDGEVQSQPMLLAAVPATLQAKPAPQAAPEQSPALPAPTADSTAESESAPQEAVRPQALSAAAARPKSHEAVERTQAGSLVSEFVQATRPGTDGLQLAGLQPGRDFGQMVAATAQSSSSDGAGRLASAPVPLEALAVEIAARAQGGRNRFEIRLDPPELGRIEVRLDIDRSGQVTSRLVVERAETLDVLRRDAHQLERALQDAGLKTSDNGLQFTLRDQAFADRNDNGSDSRSTLIADTDAPVVDSAPAGYGLTLRGGSGVDIRV
jgi:flagellar hook-length control protein FliK